MPARPRVAVIRAAGIRSAGIKAAGIKAATSRRRRPSIKGGTRAVIRAALKVVTRAGTSPARRP